jgi:hypothetical protein
MENKKRVKGRERERERERERLEVMHIYNSLIYLV